MIQVKKKMRVIHFYTFPIGVAVIFFLTWIKFVHPESQLEENVDECVQMQLASRPKSEDRFDIDLEREACGKKSEWLEMAMTAAEKPDTTPALSPSQLAWADKVYQCVGITCMCEMSRECKEELAHEKIKSRAISPAEKSLIAKIGKAKRKEIRRLTDSERYRFFAVMQTLKTQMIDGLSKYDIMIAQHTPEQSPGAHSGAAFLPFHREFLKNLEVALRTINSKIALPYWDSTMDVGLPDPRDSILWSDEFMGNGFGDVTSGPFGNWTTLTDAKLKDLSPNKRIVRKIGVAKRGRLCSDKYVQNILNKPTFLDLVYCHDPSFDFLHGGIHIWIGGHMNSFRLSPNDPIFFLVHGFVDYLWEAWRQLRQDYNQRPKAYPSDEKACNEFSYGQVKMRPFSIKNIDGLSNHYTDILYSYEPSPTCSRLKPDCQSQYLFCHIGKEKCFSKVKVGGNCSGLEQFDSCAGGTCQEGLCKRAKLRRSVKLTIEQPEIS